MQGIRRRDTKYLTAFDYGTDCSSGGSNSGSSGDASMQDNSNLVPSSELPLDRGLASSHCSHCRKSPAASSAPSCNQQAYGEDSPPVYNMSAITTPLALFSGEEMSLGQQASWPKRQAWLAAPGASKLRNAPANRICTTTLHYRPKCLR